MSLTITYKFRLCHADNKEISYPVSNDQFSKVLLSKFQVLEFRPKTGSTIYDNYFHHYVIYRVTYNACNYTYYLKRLD